MKYRTQHLALFFALLMLLCTGCTGKESAAETPAPTAAVEASSPERTEQVTISSGVLEQLDMDMAATARKLGLNNITENEDGSCTVYMTEEEKAVILEQLERTLKKEIDKITDNDLKTEFEKEYNARKFNTWHKWKKSNNVSNINLPDVDAVTKNTLIYIVNTFPELAERYLDFLGTLNIDFDGVAGELNLDFKDAEKYIVFLKLQRYIDKLNLQKQDLTSRMLMGDENAREELNKIDDELSSAHQKRETLLAI